MTLATPPVAGHIGKLSRPGVGDTVRLDYSRWPRSDIDIAVAAGHALTAAEKMAIIEALAESTGLSIYLMDLKVAAEPLPGQILRHGRRIQGDDGADGRLISRHLFEQADFIPYAPEC